MASLLSLRPSKTMEEKQELTRSKILNSPALPSSSGLLTSFGGLKKEESLSKSKILNRNTLGVVVKKSKIDDLKYEQTGDEITNNGTSILNISKNIIIDEKSASDKERTETDNNNERVNQKKLQAKNEYNGEMENTVPSLVGDYSSSENSD